jgi:MinD-like ATPase involved in chromosome partitioning or flagellar assembly
MKEEKHITNNVNRTRAYVLIDTKPGMAANVVRDIRSRGISQVDVINGPHSAIAVVQGNSASEVAVVILIGIKRLDGVKGVTVYLAEAEQEIASR